MASRAANSIRNARVGLIVYVFDLLLTFFSRKYFIEFLGPDLLGLNSLSRSLLQFLNLAELGIATAVAFSLYKPLAENDRKSINEIISVQAYFYRWIFYFLLIASAILMAFFPLIFAGRNVPLYYAYAAYISLLVGILLSYRVNYRQIIFNADQKQYINTWIFQGGKVIKNLLQLGVLFCFDPSYSFWIWLGMEVLLSVLSAWGLEWAVKKHYPYLAASPILGKQVRHLYPNLITTTKQVFFHRFGGFALAQSSVIIIYAYATLKDVTIFDNYNFIVLGLIVMWDNLFSGSVASVGNFIAEQSQAKVQQLYWEMFAFKSWLCGVVVCGMMFLAQPFITLWVGVEYQMPKTALFWLMGTLFIRLFRNSTEAFIYAYGLYKDIYAPLVEAALNFGLSALLGYYFGMTGIMAGVFISLFIVVFLWKPFFLFREKMQQSPVVYFSRMSVVMLLIVVSVLATYFIKNLLPINPAESIVQWILYGVISVSICGTVGFVLFYLFSPGMRTFCRRLVGLRSKKSA